MIDLIEVRRAKFEEWACAFGWGAGRMSGRDAKYYRETTTQVAWVAWNTALDSAVVELPAKASECEGGSYSVMQAMAANQMRDKCRDAIHAAGVPTK